MSAKGCKETPKPQCPDPCQDKNPCQDPCKPVLQCQDQTPKCVPDPCPPRPCQDQQHHGHGRKKC